MGLVANGLTSPAAAWLLLDVDGVLNVETSNSKARKLGLRSISLQTWDTGLHRQYRMHLHTWVDHEIRRHPVLRPAWCTSWWAEANTMIGNRVGLGPWPTVDLEYYNNDPHASKVDGIAELVGDSPFVWIDDDPGADVHERLAALPGPSLLIVTDPTVGLTTEHLEQAAQWAGQQIGRHTSTS